MLLTTLERELHQCLAYPYEWRTMQNDADDRATQFVYRESSFAAVQSQIAQLPPRLHGYARARWLNYWSAIGLQALFESHPRVRPHPDVRHKTIDFFIDGIPFDLKTTVFPKGFPGSVRSALESPRLLIDWLYAHQSSGHRQHNANRLFLVLCARDGRHWRLKAELHDIGTMVEDYLDHFSPDVLHRLPGNARADCIWHLA